MKKETIIRWILILIILILFPTSLIWADGGYFSNRSVAVSADQRAIIIMNGDEISMTFSTGYTGEGEDFGWLIPTPVLPAAKDVSETGKNGERAFEILDEYTAPVFNVHHGYFPSGTEVLTAGGPCPIETVEPGTEVYIYDFSTGTWILAKVIKRQSFQWEGDMVTIYMGQNTIQATGNHPFFVIRGDRLASRPQPQEIPKEEQRTTGGGRWVEACDLQVGDILKDKGGEGLIINDLSSRYEQTEVYNLKVEGYSNYAVHKIGILVHNAKKGGGEADLFPMVIVYGKVTLEHYEVSILGAADASALMDWLQKNSYQVNPEAEKVLNAYIDENWAFVAVKLNPSEKRHYENEFLPPLTIRYQYNHLVYPLCISSVSTTRTAKITLYVIAESWVTSSNFPTATLKYKDYLSKQVDPEEYIESCIQRTMASDGWGLVVLWRGELLYKHRLEITDKLMKIPFPLGEKVYLTRLESRMNPSAMTEDIRFTLDLSPDDFKVHITTWKGISHVFIIAVRAGKTDTVQKMLQTGTDVNVKDSDGNTALMWAAEIGHTEIVQPLLEADADVNARNKYGMTALMYAAWRGHTEIVQLLLQAGADVNPWDRNGKMALWYAERGGNKEIVELIRQAMRK